MIRTDSSLTAFLPGARLSSTMSLALVRFLIYCLGQVNPRAFLLSRFACFSQSRGLCLMPWVPLIAFQVLVMYSGSSSRTSEKGPQKSLRHPQAGQDKDPPALKIHRVATRWAFSPGRGCLKSDNMICMC